MQFRTVLLSSGKTTTGIEVPEDVVAGLGPGKRHAVSVTVNGYTYRSTVTPYQGKFMISVSAEVREKAGIAAGEEIDVTLEPDSAPRDVEVPADFAAALDAEPDARRFFDSLSFSNKQRHVLSIEDAKTPETRARRIEKAMEALREGRK